MIPRASIEPLWKILRYTYSLLLIVTGLDKFFNILTDWDKYLSPFIRSVLPISAYSFMLVVGVIEIIAGFIVWYRTRLGSTLVMWWLIFIAINLSMANYYDIAIRDLVIAVGAWALSRLSLFKNEGIEINKT